MPAPDFTGLRHILLSGLQPQRQLAVADSLKLTPGLFVVVFDGVRQITFRTTDIQAVTHQRDGNIPQNGRHFCQRQGIATTKVRINQLPGVANTAVHNRHIHRGRGVEIHDLVSELNQR